MHSGFRKKYIPAWLWAAFIMFICGVPGQAVPPIYLFSFDKLGHSVIFLMLHLLLILPMHVDGKLLPRHHIIAASIAVIYAALTEILQATVFINRFGDVRDFLADILGVFAGLIFLLLIRKTTLHNKLTALFPR